MPRLTFYYKHGCHLCEDMWQLLLDFQKERAFELDSKDIELDQALKDRYGTLIPVLAAGEEILCNYYLDPVALNLYLDRQEGAA